MPDVQLNIKGKNVTHEQWTQLRRDIDSTNSALHGASGAADDLGKKARVVKADLGALAMVSGAVAASAGLLVRSFIGAAVQHEKQKRALLAVAGSAQEAERQLKALREIAKLPGLGFEEAEQGSISLQAAGMSAQMAERAVAGFGGALAQIGKGRAELGMVLWNLSQIAGQGKVLGRDLRDMSNQLPMVRKLMKEIWGATTAEQLAKLNVTSEAFIEGLLTGLEKLPKVTKGAAVSLENLGDNIRYLRADLGDVLLPTYSKLIDALSATVEWMTKLSATSKAIISWSTVSVAGIATMTASIAALGLLLPRVRLAVLSLGAAFTWLHVHPVVAAASGIVALAGVLGLYIKWTKEAGKVTKEEWESSLSKLRDITTKEQQHLIDTGNTRRKQIQERLKDLRAWNEYYDKLFARIESGIAVDERRWAGLKKRYSETKQEIKDLTAEYEKIGKEIETVATAAGIAVKLPKLPEPPKPYEPSEEEIKLQRELEKAQMGRIENAYARERALAEKEAAWKVEDYQKQIAEIDKVGGQEEKRALLLRAIEEENTALRRRFNEIAAKEADELHDKLRDAADQRREWAEEESALAKEKADEGAKAAEEALAAYQSAARTRFETERMRIEQIEDSYDREQALAYLNWRTRTWEVQQLLTSEKTSSEERRALIEQERGLWDAYQAEKAAIAKKRDDEILEKDLERIGRENKAAEEAYERQVAARIKAEEEGAAAIFKLREWLWEWEERNWNDLVADVEESWARIASSGEEAYGTLEEGADDAVDMLSRHFGDFVMGFETSWEDIGTDFRRIVARMVAEWVSGHAKMVAITLAMGLKDISIYTAKAAAAAYSAIAGIPVVGPILAPAAAVAAIATIGALVKDVMKMQEGGVLPGRIVETYRMSQPARLTPVKAFQGGGIASEPTVALIGEGSEEEAVVPLTRGRKIPVELRGGVRDVYFQIEKIEAVFPGANLEDMDQARFDRIFHRKIMKSLRNAASNGYISRGIFS